MKVKQLVNCISQFDFEMCIYAQRVVNVSILEYLMQKNNGY